MIALSALCNCLAARSRGLRLPGKGFVEVLTLVLPRFVGEEGWVMGSGDVERDVSAIFAGAEWLPCRCKDMRRKDAL